MGRNGNLIIMLVLAVIVLPSLSAAENYEVNVTRKGSNLYKVTTKDIYIITRYCYEYVYYEDSFLKMHGPSGKIIFMDSGAKCDVKGVYGRSNEGPGKYAVTVSREADDWFEVMGYGIFIKTSGCLSLALGTDAVLSIQGGGYGTLHIDGSRCMVEGLYSQLQL